MSKKDVIEQLKEAQILMVEDLNSGDNCTPEYDSMCVALERFIELYETGHMKESIKLDTFLYEMQKRAEIEARETA